MINPKLKSALTSFAVQLVLLVIPSFWLGQYTSDQKNKEDKTQLMKTIEDQSEDKVNSLREQRIELKEEKSQEIARIMLICTKASTSALSATESAKGVLETVEENRASQVEAIRDSLNSEVPADTTSKKRGSK